MDRSGASSVRELLVPAILIVVALSRPVKEREKRAQDFGQGDQARREPSGEDCLRTYADWSRIMPSLPEGNPAENRKRIPEVHGGAVIHRAPCPQ